MDPRLIGTFSLSPEICILIWGHGVASLLLARSSIVSELGFITSFVWVRAIYCFLNQSCEPFLELPAHPFTLALPLKLKVLS